MLFGAEVRRKHAPTNEGGPEGTPAWKADPRSQRYECGDERTRPRGGERLRSLAGETVHLVDRTSVAVGDHGHHFAPVAGVGGVFYELAVDAGEELEILGVIDENVTGSGDRFGEVFAVGTVESGLANGVRAHDEGQFAAAEQAQAVHDAPILAEHVPRGNTLL